MSVAKIDNFYKAAYLLSVDVPIQKIERENNKSYYFFQDESFVKQELELYENDPDLQLFVKGIVKLRRLLHEQRDKQDKIVSSTSAQTPEEALHPIED